MTWWKPATWFRRKPRPEPGPAGDVRRRAVLVGLDRVDPAGHGGWEGECPGAVLDVSKTRTALMAQGLRCEVRVNGLATWGGVADEVRSQAADLCQNELLVLLFSGHGWRAPDVTGTEPDGYTEGLCFFDRRVSDDEILALILSLPPCRVLILSDHCHAAGDAFPRSSARPWRIKPHRARASWGGQVIQFAGCRSEAYSYGSATGGTWSGALLAAFDPALSYRDWFKRAASRMPSSQTPELVTWQERGFLDRRALT